MDMGSNDGVTNTQAAIVSWIAAFRASVNTTTPVFMLIPWGQLQAANIKAAIVTAHDPYVYAIDLGLLYTLNTTQSGATRDSYDGQHPTGYANGWLASVVAQKIQSILNPVSFVSSQ